MNKILTAAQDSPVLAEINITPFTDVLLVLLIIFMILAALLIPPGFKKQLANGGTSHSAATHQIVVSIDRRGGMTFDGKQASTQGLYAAMARAGARAHISLVADAHAPYGLALRVLDAAKLAGISDVVFITQ